MLFLNLNLNKDFYSLSYISIFKIQINFEKIILEEVFYQLFQLLIFEIV